VSDDPDILLHVEAPAAYQWVPFNATIEVTGWALSRDPLADIFIDWGGTRQSARRGLFRADLARVFPDRADLANAGFSALIGPPEGCPAESSLIITALCANGRQKQIEIPLYLDQTVRQTRQDPLELNGGEAIAMAIDEAFVDTLGFLVLEGRTASQTPLEKIEIFIDGIFAGQALFQNHRFSFVTDAAGNDGALTILLRASAFGGFTADTHHRIDSGPNLPRRPLVEMQRLECQRAVLSPTGALLLSGFALSIPKVAAISVFQGDEKLGDAVYGGAQPAIGNRFPAIPHAHLPGFLFATQLSAPLRDAVFEIEALLENGKSFRTRVTAGSDQQVALGEGTPDPIFTLDEPKIVDGALEAPLLGGLSIAGWAISRGGVDRIVVELDGKEVGTAYHGMRREDVFKAYPEWPKALLSGFAYSLPHRAFSLGEHLVSIRVIGANAEERRQSFKVTVGTGEVNDKPWILRRKVPAAEHLLIKACLERMKSNRRFLLFMTVNSVSQDLLRRTLRSLDSQIHSHWLLVIGAPADSKASITSLLDEFEVRPRAVFIEKVKVKAGDWFLRIDPGHECAPDLLAEIALAVDADDSCDLVYADERRLDGVSGTVEAFFKPDWSPHLLLSTNYIGRPFAMPLGKGADLLTLAKLSDYDLLLERVEASDRIHHIPKLLYERDDASDPKMEKAALEHMAKRRKLKAMVEPGRVVGTFRLKSKTKIDGLVSIIIPTCAARGLIERCIESIRNRSSYKNIEIIIVDNILDPESRWKPWLIEHADVVVEILEPFNWSRFNNIAAEEASGDYLLFLNDDIEIIQPDWLEAMLEETLDPTVGIVGPQLLYPDGKVQHAGLFLSELGRARHAFRFSNDDDPGPFGLALTRRNVIGLTGACILMRREVFENAGRFDEVHTIVNNDLDFCLKVHEQGLWNVYTPFAQLIHHELASRAELKDDHDRTAFNERWASLFLKGDPFFSRMLSHAHDDYQYDAEPEQLVVAGHPYYLREKIRRIIAIKIDHIGDFVTGIPAFRRLKAHFPDAHLTVLAAPASLQLAELEPSIDEIIPFAFFHARSGLGQKERDEEMLAELRTSLTSKRFDLAIDLRKHPDSRGLLKYTGAPLLAGFEYEESLPWLDIARPSEKDERFTPKHTHIGDDLLGLVNDVALAGEQRREGVVLDDAFRKKAKAIRSRFMKTGLFAKPVAAFHLAAGTEMRQWPPAYFAMLIDWLIEADGVTAVLIGTPDDADIIAATLADAAHRDEIVSLAGKLKLSELPYFLANCALFVGNNSGPQHLAGSLGIPAIGIHSGVVDPREWGPLGERAVAIKKEMTCSPCYLSKPADCHRGLGCLTQLTPGAVFPICQRLLHLSKPGV